MKADVHFLTTIDIILQEKRYFNVLETLDLCCTSHSNNQGKYQMTVIS